MLRLNDTNRHSNNQASASNGPSSLNNKSDPVAQALYEDSLTACLRRPSIKSWYHPTEAAKKSAAFERVKCAYCGQPRWWHLQARSIRRDDGHEFALRIRRWRRT